MTSEQRMRDWSSPILYEGEKMADRPVYWLIWILDADTGKPYNIRVSSGKYLDPRDAMQSAYGMQPTPNCRFFNLGHTITGLRKRLREAAVKYNEAMRVEK